MCSLACRRLCCLCGLPIQSNPANMCVNCMRSQVDITEAVQKQVRRYACSNSWMSLLTIYVLWQKPSRERDKKVACPNMPPDMHGCASLAAQMLCRTVQYCTCARAGTTQHDALTLVGGTQVTLMVSPNAQVTIFFCRGCGRYLQPPRHWVKAELESRELLTFCVKRIRGLGKVGDVVGDSDTGDGEQGDERMGRETRMRPTAMLLSSSGAAAAQC